MHYITNLRTAKRRKSKSATVKRRRLRAEVLEARVVLAAPGHIVINEIMQNPSAVRDLYGEWFEVVNTTSSDIDINEWTISDNDIDSHVINNGGPLVVPALGYLVLGRNSDFSTNGGVSVDYQYSSIQLANGEDEIVLADTNAIEIDRVEWDDGDQFPDPNGASMALHDALSDNNVGTNWCQSTTAFGAGDFGTPGAENDCTSPASAGDVVINEIMQNPRNVSDANGEWFELYNATSSDIDLNGWTIKDNDRDRHVITHDGPLILPAGGYLVLGNNANSATNGGVVVNYEYSTPFFLANTSDELVLLDSLRTEIDRVEWDNGVTFPDPNGASMALGDPSLDNSLGFRWCISSTPLNSGDFGTPGAENDCAPVPDAGANQTVFRNESVELEGSWTDPQAASDNPYDWSWDLDGDGSPDTSGSASYGTTIGATTSFADAGVYVLTFTVTDKIGAKGTDTVEITVLNRPPDCSNVQPSIETIWPPNHKFVAVDILGATDPDGDPVTITIDSIFQDELVDGPGSGNTRPDAAGVGTSTANVRAERNGGGNGRVYHISYTADDGLGGSCTGTVQVFVPHSKKAAAIDDGALYDSTVAAASTLVATTGTSVVTANSAVVEEQAITGSSKRSNTRSASESFTSRKDQWFALLGDDEAEDQEIIHDLLEEAEYLRSIRADLE